MRSIYVMTGNIGSGKSTLVGNIIAINKNRTIVCVSRDSLRYMIGHGQYVFDIKLEGVIRSTSLFCIEEYMKLGVDIVVDETNMSIKSRAPVLDMANKYGYKKISMAMFVLPMSECVNRRLFSNHGRTTREEWEKIWTGFHDKYERPSCEEGFDEVNIQLQDGSFKNG